MIVTAGIYTLYFICLFFSIVHAAETDKDDDSL